MYYIMKNMIIYYKRSDVGKHDCYINLFLVSLEFMRFLNYFLTPVFGIVLANQR
jgi:hypothetical protein